MIILSIFDRNKQPLTQIFGVLACQIRETLSDVSTAEIDIATRLADGNMNQDIKEIFFAEMNIIEIRKNDGEKEEILFEGFISSVIANWEYIRISLKDFLGILEYRILKNSKKFLGVSVKTLLETVWNEASEIPFALDCTVTENISKDYEIGRSILDIFKDIASAGYEFRMDGNTLRFGKEIGKNQSETVVYRKEWHSPNEWNISEVKSEYHAANTHNFILTKIGSSPPYSVKDDASIEKYGRKEKFITVSGDNTTLTPAGYLAEHKNSSRELAITPTDSRWTHIAVGDRIGVYIDSGNDILHFRGSLKISEKTYIHGDLDEINIVVATASAKSISVMDKIKTIDTRLSHLENSNT